METPVVRSRGRPRKRRRKEEENETDDRKLIPEAKRQAIGTRPIALIGRYVLKEFSRSGVFIGKVVYYEYGLYRVSYEDGDFEDLDSSEIRAILLNDSDFDDDLSQRRITLDESVLQNSVKVADGSKKGPADPKKGISKVEAPMSSELHGELENVEEPDEADDDSSSDSSTGSMEKDSEPDAETPPPPLQLPPSSGTIGVAEPYVSHLFAVYGFLRSFSTRLFLTPFTLDEFVGCLNCRVSNTLFDAIHVSLMRALRRNLETLSSEGSELASKCLRFNDWSLLDTLTWPVFVIQYLAVNGCTKGPEWKGFYDELFNGEYYMLPVSRKLIVLQILCDDVLDSEELKAEISMREESEVGMDYDAEDIPPAENGPGRVHPRYPKTSACKDKEAIKYVSESNAVNLPGNAISYFRDTERTEDGDDDRNGDECRLCGMDGTLLCCDGCPSAYHSRCIGVMKMYIPEGPWYCPECKINMIGPTIAKGTSLRGAEVFGQDLYGQLFMGTCDHLLVLNVNNDEFCLRYYNRNDIPNVLQVLYASMQHRPIYYGICLAILQYWSIPESFLPLSITTGTNMNSANKMEDAKFSTSSLPPFGEEDHKPYSLVKVEYPLTTVSLIHSDNMVASLDASLVTTQSPAPESSVSARTKECAAMNTSLPNGTWMESVISAGPGSGSGSVSQQSHMNYQHSVNRPTAVNSANCSLVNSQFSNYGLANDTVLPMNFPLQTKEGNRVGFGKCEHNINNDFGYMGCSYKPQSYINYYMHGDFAASAAAKLAVLSSEDSRSEGHVSDYQRKATSGNTYLQAKAFSLMASRFFWPSSEKKLVEVPRERCGWCFSCKAPVSSKRGCMLNHAALSATKSAMKILSGFSPVRSGEGILPSIATYIIYMEECLHGLILGPFLSTSYRKQWRTRVELAKTFSAIKPLLLKLEENIRMIAFYGDWVKLMDDWLVESSIIQSATCTLGTTQKRASSGRRYKKRSAVEEDTADGCHENNFAWWRGGKFTKFLFQLAVLPKSVARKAARQGGSKKISGIVYADGSEIPKRSRQLAWRVAVQMSRNASQLALQVRYLDFYLRWSDLIRPEQNIQDGKGQETEASAFRNASICEKKLAEGKAFYGIAFGSQKHLPSRVMKSVVEIEQGLEGKEKYWFSETRIPLYLVKEYEEGNEKVPSDEKNLNIASQLHRRQLKAICKDIFFYLTCKRDKLDVFSCSVCQLGVVIGIAFKCSACQGYCHEGCSISSTVSTNEEVEFLTTCKQCYHAKLLTQKVASNESPTSPLQGQEHGPMTVTKGSRPMCYDQGLKSSRTKDSRPDLKQVASVTVPKGPRPKCYDQAPISTRTKDSHPDMKQVASDSTLATKNRRRNCSWGIIWKKKNNETADIDFRIKNILLKGGSGVPQLAPVCHLCRKPYRSDLMYICCETCSNWYHAEAVELEESRIFEVLGFKCCKCRRIKSPVCPYTDLKLKIQLGKKTHTRASKKENSGADSDSGTLSDMKECEPATPVSAIQDISGQVNDPLLFSLSSVELITEPKLDMNVEWNGISGPGPQKLPVRRHVKHEGDGDNSIGGKPLHDEFSTQNETGHLSNPAEVLSPLEYDPAVCLEGNLLNDSESVDYECMEFEPHTYFSVTELLHPDDSSQFEGANASGEMSGYLEDSSTLGVTEECTAVGLVDKSGPGISLQGSAYNCWQCLEMEPPPDLSCEICGLWVHSQCSPWVESPSRVGSWRCGNCREWQ